MCGYMFPYLLISFFQNQPTYTVTNNYKQGLSIIGCLATSLSRIYLGQHYFSDCFVAILYGVPFGMLLECVYFKSGFGASFQDCFGFSPYSQHWLAFLIGMFLLGLVIALLSDKQPQRFWDKGVVMVSLLTSIFFCTTMIIESSEPNKAEFHLISFAIDCCLNIKGFLACGIHTVQSIALLVHFKKDTRYRNGLFNKIVFYILGWVITLLTFFVAYKP